MDFAQHTEDIDVTRITPPHEVRDTAKLAALTASMAADGWQGRPLLVLDLGDDTYVALTGSHRNAAARAAGLETVPCVVVPVGERLTADVNVYWGGYDVRLDGERLYENEGVAEALRLLGEDVAAALMEMEQYAEDAE